MKGNSGLPRLRNKCHPVGRGFSPAAFPAAAARKGRPTSPGSWRFAIFCALILLILVSVIVEAKKSAKETILKSRSAGITAGHLLHVSDNAMQCLDCHGKALSSKDAADFLIPSHKTCLACHDEATCSGDFVDACRKCHMKKPASIISLRLKHKKYIEIIFPHAKHTGGKKTKEKCSKCHLLPAIKNVKKGKLSNPSLPGMKLCLSCHEHAKEYDAQQCLGCHFKQKDGTIKTKLKGAVVLKPPAWMAGLEHGGLWYKEHEVSAANNASLCASCHSSEDCDACHAGTGKTLPAKIHPNDWIQMHGLSSMSNDLNCASCHNMQHFCLTCHRRSGVAWDSPSGLAIPSGSVFHPQGWYSFSGNNSHALKARTSLSSCVSCHTENDCMKCHASQLSPHPPGAIWKNKCQTLKDKNPDVCLKCHAMVPPCNY